MLGSVARPVLFMPGSEQKTFRVRPIIAAVEMIRFSEQI